MVNTLSFKTATEIVQKNNVSIENYWPMAIDYGFSATKGISPNMIYRFPSYARETTGTLIGESRDTDIQYKGEDGIVWNVGQMAQDMIVKGESVDAAAMLYGRNRYFTPMFKVIIRAGLALGMMGNNNGSPIGRTIVLQTGLPPEYIEEDTSKLKKSISGHHSFYLKIGRGQWTPFDIDLLEENIYVMPQPLGSVYSAICNEKAGFISEAKDILTSDLLVFDGGFGTFDVAEIKSRQIDKTRMMTDEALGMKAILQLTTDKIFRKYNTKIKVPEFQKCLGDGFFKTFDEENMRTTQIRFADILEESSREICMKMLGKTKTMYNNFIDYKYIIVTGGTGAAWYEYITSYLSGMEGLHVIGANRNEILSHVYSNVRGYYMYLVNNIRRAA